MSKHLRPKNNELKTWTQRARKKQASDDGKGSVQNDETQGLHVGGCEETSPDEDEHNKYFAVHGKQFLPARSFDVNKCMTDPMKAAVEKAKRVAPMYAPVQKLKNREPAEEG